MTVSGQTNQRAGGSEEGGEGGTVGSEAAREHSIGVEAQ